MVKVGVIGCGKIAITRHLPEYASNPDVEIAGVYDFNLERAKEVAEQYQTRAYESVEEMLNDPQIEAVSVCVRKWMHCVLGNMFYVKSRWQFHWMSVKKWLKQLKKQGKS